MRMGQWEGHLEEGEAQAPFSETDVVLLEVDLKKRDMAVQPGEESLGFIVLGGRQAFLL